MVVPTCGQLRISEIDPWAFASEIAMRALARLNRPYEGNGRVLIETAVTPVRT
jgi:hypothetical protein